MFFDSKNFGLADVAIAMELAKEIDDGQPKARLSDSLRRGWARLWRHRVEVIPQTDEQPRRSTQETAQSWR